MPIYEYECSQCHQTSDALQKVNDPPPETCPRCGAHDTLTRLLSRTSFVLKGGGCERGWRRRWRLGRQRNGRRQLELRIRLVWPGSGELRAEGRRGEGLTGGMDLRRRRLGCVVTAALLAGCAGRTAMSVEQREAVLRDVRSSPPRWLAISCVRVHLDASPGTTFLLGGPLEEQEPRWPGRSEGILT